MKLEQGCERMFVVMFNRFLTGRRRGLPGEGLSDGQGLFGLDGEGLFFEVFGIDVGGNTQPVNPGGHSTACQSLRTWWRPSCSHVGIVIIRSEGFQILGNLSGAIVLCTLECRSKRAS